MWNRWIKQNQAELFVIITSLIALSSLIPQKISRVGEFFWKHILDTKEGIES